MGALRLFVGLMLPDAYQQGLESIRETWEGRLPARAAWTRPGNWHVTLKFLGNVEQDAVPDVEQALAQVPFAPFTLKAGGCGVFPQRGRPRVLWVGVTRGSRELAALADGVDHALEALGFALRDRELRPHLTLARMKYPRKKDRGRERGAQKRGQEPVSRAGWPEVGEAVAKQRWDPVEVAQFTLFKSVLGPDGPRYTALADIGATSL